MLLVKKEKEKKIQIKLPFAPNAIVTVSQPQLACSDLITAQQPEPCRAAGL